MKMIDFDKVTAKICGTLSKRHGIDVQYLTKNEFNNHSGGFYRAEMRYFTGDKSDADLVQEVLMEKYVYFDSLSSLKIACFEIVRLDFPENIRFNRLIRFMYLPEYSERIVLRRPASRWKHRAKRQKLKCLYTGGLK
jgi:hypothetical protein